MTNETSQATVMQDNKALSFGVRLQSAREALGLERKDIAAQLRLNEKIIAMLEEDLYPTDLPATFIRGYLRSYSKLVDIPEQEVKEAIAPLQPKPVIEEEEIPQYHPRPEEPVTSSNYFMQFITYLIMLTVAGLTGLWWYNHTNPPTTPLAEPGTTEVVTLTNRGPRNTSDTTLPTNENEGLSNQENTAIAAAQAASTPLEASQSVPNNAPIAKLPSITAPIASKNNVSSDRISNVQKSPVLTSADDQARKHQFASAVQSGAYNPVTSASDFSILVVLSLIAYWLYTPAAHRRSHLETPKKSAVIKKFPKSKVKKNGKVIRTLGMIVSGLFQDLTAFASNRLVQMISGLALVSVLVVTTTIWWKQHLTLPAPVVAENKVIHVPTRAERIVRNQLNRDPVLTALSKFGSSPMPGNDVAFIKLNDPSIATGRLVEYIKQNPVIAAVVQPTPAPKQIVRRQHHAVPAVASIDSDDSDDDDDDD